MRVLDTDFGKVNVSQPPTLNNDLDEDLLLDSARIHDGVVIHLAKLCEPCRMPQFWVLKRPLQRRTFGFEENFAGSRKCMPAVR